MKKSLIFITAVVFTLAFASVAFAGPTTLKTVYVTNHRVDLSWMAQSDEAYKVWQSTDGRAWTNIATTAQGASTYTVNGLTDYTNYFFNVTTTAVNGYPEGISESNSANEVDAFPPNQHAHAYYSSNTSLCKNCHNAHISTGPKLLSFATVNDTCMSCHDGTGSKYDVITGMVSTSTNKSTAIEAPSGPFGGKVFGKSPIANEPESIHSLGAVINTAPGGNPNGSGKWSETLGCGSCHDAHGGANYRMLRSTLPYGSDISVKAYAYTDATAEGVNYISGMNNFCNGCHPAYNAPTGAGNTKFGVDYGGGSVSGDAYRHSMGVSPASFSIGGVLQPLTTSLPLEGLNSDYNKNRIICLSCHTSHGSTKASVSSDIYDPDGMSNKRNYLLRMDNDGVCEDCHKL